MNDLRVDPLRRIRALTADRARHVEQVAAIDRALAAIGQILGGRAGEASGPAEGPRPKSGRQPAPKPSKRRPAR